MSTVLQLSVVLPSADTLTIAIEVVGATLAYPLAVYFGLRHLPPLALAAALAAVVGLRLLLDRQRHWRPVGVVLLVFCALAIWRDDVVTLRLYPVLVNLVNGFIALINDSLYRGENYLDNSSHWIHVSCLE